MANEHLLFEDAGQLKAGTILQEGEGSLQVESASGKRSKVKSVSVLMRFSRPDPEALMREAGGLAEQIDRDFLWECAPQEEFDFGTLATDYFGEGRGVVQDAALLLRLHASPIHFHRKGRGRFRPAQPDTLRAALASVERKKQQEIRVDALADELVAGRLPPEIAAVSVDALRLRDRQTVELRAVDRAAERTGLAVQRLMLNVGAFASARELFRSRFLHENFPGGRIEYPEAAIASFRPPLVAGLPDAGVEAFSIDDRTTTEIDDCLSMQVIDERTVRLGIHIAAPALSIELDGPLDRTARERMTTVYSPGEKFTMLPENVVRAFSLDEGTEKPALSLYVDVRTENQQIVGHFSRLDRIRIARNLRQQDVDGLVDEAMLDRGELPPMPDAQAILAFWRFTLAQSAERDRVRGRPEARFRVDYNFYVDGDHVDIVRRRRDLPLDRIVAEMAILANSHWGKLLGDHGVPGLYRSQGFGRVRMTTHPAEHQGLGVAQYAWCTSPLRRYVDLINQMQLLSVLEGEPPVFERNDATLFSILSAFESRYATVGDYQQMMERYWCLRWLGQQIGERSGRQSGGAAGGGMHGRRQDEGVPDERSTADTQPVESAAWRQFDATATRDEAAVLVDAPLYLRLQSMPMVPQGQRLVVSIDGWDELDLTVDARFVRLIDDAGPVEAAGVVLNVVEGPEPDPGEMAEQTSREPPGKADDIGSGPGMHGGMTIPESPPDEKPAD